MRYMVEGTETWFYGDELMNGGLITTDAAAGQAMLDQLCTDFWSKIYVLKGKESLTS